jgi:hypothetical protein
MGLTAWMYALYVLGSHYSDASRDAAATAAAFEDQMTYAASMPAKPSPLDQCTTRGALVCADPATVEKRFPGKGTGVYLLDDGEVW